MENKKSIIRIFSASMIFLVFISISITGFFWISYEYNMFDAESEILRTEYLDSRKSMLRNEVDRVTDYIEFKKSQEEERLRRELKSRADEVYEIVMDIYRGNKDSKKFPDVNAVKDALKPIRFNKGKECCFIISSDGTAILSNADLDKKSSAVIRNMIDIAKKSKEGFYEYAPLREHGKNFPKTAYIKYFAPFEWIIGTQDTPDTIDKVIRSEVLERIEKISFEKDGYIFVGQWDGLALTSPAKGKNMYDVEDVNGVKIVQELIQVAKNGGGFVRYILPELDGGKSYPKISYAKGIEDWQWYVGAGVNIHDIEGIIEKKQRVLNKKIESHILQTVFILIILLGLIFLIAEYILDKVKINFKVFSSFFKEAAMRHKIKIDPAMLHFSEFEALAISANQMAEARRRAETEILLNKARFETLYKLTQMINEPEDVIKDFVLEEGVRMTGSKIGYICFVNEDETVLTFHAWSKEAMKECRVPDRKVVYKVEETGLWGEAVRQRKPVLTNDYDAASPLKKGCPKGHVQIKRCMNIPVFDNGKIVLVAGVGNKDIRYDESDVRQLSLIMDGMWRSIQKKKTEDALRKSEERFDLAVRGSSDGLWDWTDPSQDSLWMSPRFYELIGYREEELGGSFFKFAKLLHPEDRNRGYKALRAHLEQQTPYDVTYRVRMKSGEYRWFQTRGQALWDRYGKPVRMSGSLRDIDERKRAEEEIRKLNELLEQRVQERTAELLAANQELQNAKETAEAASRTKSEFLANMSHELRTPMNAILGFSQLMERDPHLSTAQRENLETISHSGEHLLMLINDVLDMSKIEAGQMTLNKRSFDLSRTLVKIEEMIRIRAAAKGLQFIVSQSPDAPRLIRTDEHKLRQVLINLLDNAVKFTTEGSVRLRVSRGSKGGGPSQWETENEPLTLCFEVEDSGSGIAPGEADMLFAPFVQTQSGRKSGEGSGLGLSISQKIVHLMRGDIRFESEVNRGSVFIFHIQVEPADMTEIKTEQITRRVIRLESGQPDYRILIAEDKSENRILLCKLLTSVGFNVREAINGEEAVEIYDAWKPHLIWMDMRMPIMNGYEAVRKIRKLECGGDKADAARHTPIIALTASVFEEDRTAVFSAGCDDFVRKPFKNANLFGIMSKYLGARYLYDDAQTLSQQKDSARAVLLSPALAELPYDLLGDLEQATIDLDTDLISGIIDQIRETDVPAADALTDLAKNFEYEQMLTLLSEAKKSGR